jgi:hypothetical protein
MILIIIRSTISKLKLLIPPKLLLISINKVSELDWGVY